MEQETIKPLQYKAYLPRFFESQKPQEKYKTRINRKFRSAILTPKKYAQR